MPELPDVELFRRVAERHAIGRLVASVEVLDPGSLEGAGPAVLQRRLKDSTLRTAKRHGKVLLLQAGEAAVLAMHFGTNGSLQHVPEGEPEPRFTRLCLAFANGGRLAYLNPRRIGNVQFAESAAVFLDGARLGPDVLDASFDLATFTAAVDGRKPAIKAVLMEQDRMAGVGNIYADEILFQSRLHPATQAGAMDKATVRRVFDAIKHVMQTAIDCGAGAEHFTDRLPNGFLLPQRHAGGHCPRDGTAIEQEKRGGRSGYFCPKCQKAPG